MARLRRPHGMPDFPKAHLAKGTARKKPRRYPAGAASYPKTQSEDQGLPVALGANEQAVGVLVLQLISRCRLGNARERRRRDHARVLLVKVAVGEVSREGQVLDGGPAGDDTDLADVEVRVAGAGQGRERGAAADHALGRAAVINGSPRTIERRVPVRAPV